MMPARDVTGRSDRTLLYSVTWLRSECWKKIFHILIIVLMNRILHHLILTKQKMHLLPNPMCFYIKTGVLSKIFSRSAWHVQLNFEITLEVISLRLLNAVFTCLLIGFMQPSALWLHKDAFSVVRHLKKVIDREVPCCRYRVFKYLLLFMWAVIKTIPGWIIEEITQLY